MATVFRLTGVTVLALLRTVAEDGAAAALFGRTDRTRGLVDFMFVVDDTVVDDLGEASVCSWFIAFRCLGRHGLCVVEARLFTNICID